MASQCVSTCQRMQVPEFDRVVSGSCDDLGVIKLNAVDAV